jgi:hypothetical protein
MKQRPLIAVVLLLLITDYELEVTPNEIYLAIGQKTQFKWPSGLHSL